MRKFLTFFLTALLAFGVGWAEEVTDVITAADLPATGTSYVSFSGVTKPSGAVYAGMSAYRSGDIQLRTSNDNTGIVSTTSGGKVKSVTIYFANGAKSVDIYAKNSAYTSASNLYDAGLKGTLISNVLPSQTGVPIPITDEYQYIGIRSNSGATYLTKIEITWEKGGSTIETVATPTFNPAAGVYTEPQNVTISCGTPGATIYYTTDGTIPTSSSTEYTSAIEVDETMTINAIAVKDGMYDSAIASANYSLPSGIIYKKVNSSTLVNGATYVIVYEGDPAAAMGEIVNKKGSSVTGIILDKTKNPHEADLAGKNALFLTARVVGNDGNYAFEIEPDSYLMIDNADFKTSTTSNVNTAQWTVRGDGSVYNVSATNRYICYRAGSSNVFGAYSTTNITNNPTEYFYAYLYELVTSDPIISVNPADGVVINDNTGDNRTEDLVVTVTNAQGGVTAATNPSDKWSWANDKVTYNGYALHSEGEVTFSSTNATDVNADLEYNYTGPIYIVGDVDGMAWSKEDGIAHGVEMDKNANGTYSKTITADAGGEGKAWLYFTKTLTAQNNQSDPYDALGDKRFGPRCEDWNHVAQSGQQWGLTSDLMGNDCALDTLNLLNTIKMDPGRYTITINPANNTFIIENASQPSETMTFVKVTSADQLVAGKQYIIVADGEDIAMGPIGSDNFGSIVAITKSGDDYLAPANCAITLGGSKDHYTLQLADGTYVTAGDNTKLTAGTSATEWTITNNEGTLNGYRAKHVEYSRYIRKHTSMDRFGNYANNDQSKWAWFYVKKDGETPVETVATPTFDPAGTSYIQPQTVTITCTTNGATIHYTTDGTDPSANSATYSDPITVKETTTIKAIAVKDGMNSSSIASATYTLPQTVNTLAQANGLTGSGNNLKFMFGGEVVVTYHNGDYTWLRDKDANAGGALIYQNNSDNPTPVTAQGHVYKPYWYAEKTTFQGLIEFINAANIEDSNTTAAYAPFERTGALTDANMNEYIKLNNVYINSVEEDNKTYSATATGENRDAVNYTYTLYNQFGKTIEVGRTYNITGVVTKHSTAENDVQVYPTDLELVKQDLTLGFNPAGVSIYVGETFNAPALTGVPEGETINVTYSSSNTNVATIVDNVVTLVEGATGTATITANFAGNEYYNSTTATYTIEVKEKLAHGMSFSPETLDITYGDEEYTVPTLNNPNNLTVTYSSNNESVAVVDEQTGELVLGDAGKAVITATTEGDASHSGGSVSYTINIAKAAAGLSYGETTPEFTVYVGQDFEAPTLTNPNHLTVTYSSDNEDAAFVDETGDVLIGEEMGDATITASFEGNKNYEAGSAKYIIHVIAKDNVTMSFDPTSVTLYVGDEFTQPTLNTNPANLTVEYSSNNEDVAMVDENTGDVVLMNKAGTAIITAKYAGNDQYNANETSYTIKVENRPEILIETQNLDLGTSGEGTIFVMASDLKENVTVISSNPNFTVEPEFITPEQAANGVDVVVTYNGTNTEGENATITFSTKDGKDVVVTVTAKAETYVDTAKPTFSPAAGTYTEPKWVAIACATPGATIEYTMDGETKTYDGPFLVDHNCTVTAKASKGAKVAYNDSEMASATYVINKADAANIVDNYYTLQNNADEVAGKYANVAGRRTLNFVAAEAAKAEAGTVFRIETGEGGKVETLRSQAVDLQGYANRAMAYVPKVIEVVLNRLAESSLGDPETPGTGILGENGLDLILKKFYENFDYNLYIEQANGGYRIFGRTPSMQHVVDFYHENTAQVEEKLPMLEGYINQVLDKIRNKIPAPYDPNVVVPFSLKTVRDRIADKYGITLIDPTEDLMGFYRQVLNNKEYVWDFAYQTAMMYVDVIKQTGTYQSLDPEYKRFVEKMEKVRPDTKYYIIERGNELDYISENNGEIISNDPRTLWTLEPRQTFKLNSAGELFGCPLATNGVGGYFTTNYTDFAYTLPEGVTAYKVTAVDEDGEATLEALTGIIPAQTPVLLVAKEDGAYEVTLTTEAGTADMSGNLLEGPDYLITRYQFKTPMVVELFTYAQGLLGENMYNIYVAPYEYLQLRYAGTVNNKYFWNVNSDLGDINGINVLRSLSTNTGELAFSDDSKTETNKAFMVSETLDAITLPGTLRGDVNHDGKVTIVDVAYLIDRLLGKPDPEHIVACPYCSDVNRNHEVTIVDVAVLIDILLGNGTDSTEPGEGEGE